MRTWQTMDTSDHRRIVDLDAVVSVLEQNDRTCTLYPVSGPHFTVRVTLDEMQDLLDRNAD